MTSGKFPASGEPRTRPRAASRLRYRYGHGTAAAPAMSPSSAGRQRRSLPRSGSPLWGAFFWGLWDLPGAPDASLAMHQENADRRSFRPCRTVAQGGRRGRRPRLPEKERLFAVGACHLRAFGLWKLVHRSTLRQRPGVPGNALRRIFRCLPVMWPGRRQAGLQGLGRCGRSQPFWRIEKWLTSA